jgi:alpha-tubulin suppressor-like RCC1 family protein
VLRDIYIDKSAGYLQMETLAPTSGNTGPRLALLRHKPAIDAMQVLVVDALTGASMIRTFDSTFMPRRFVVMPDLNGNGSEELALVRADPQPGTNKIQIRDSASGALIKNVWFDKSLLPQDLAVIPDSNANDAIELALLAIRPSNGARLVVIKDARSNLQLGVVGFDHAVTGLKTIDAGAAHTCGVKTDGTVECWGANSLFGQSTPPDARFSQISAGEFGTCGIRDDGAVACWGHVEAEPPAGIFSQVSLGAYFTCAIRADGTVACWGGNAPAPPPGTFQQVSLSYYLNCGLKTDGHVACWGSELTSPVDSFSSISTGGSYVCGLRASGTVACWGQTDYGLSTPPGGTFRQISAGDHHACGVRTDGSVACWGLNDDGQSNAPTGSFRQVSAGGRHTCGLEPDGTVRCWGLNSYGQSTPGWVGE